MRRMPLVGLAVVSLAVGIVALGIVLARPADPAPVPVGALPLALRTQSPEWRFPGLPRGCPLAELSPVRLVREDQSLGFESIDDGQRLAVVFPYGFSARLVAGRGELVSPGGHVLAREGDVVSRLMGSSASNGEFILCFDAATSIQVDHMEQ